MVAIRNNGLTHMSIIQEIALARLLAHDQQDLYIRSNPGTGKSIASAIAMLDRIDLAKDYPQVVYICPSHEVAMQMIDVIRQFNCKLRAKIGRLLVSETGKQ